MTTYSYSDGNITLSGTGALDDLVFTDDTGGSFDFKAFSYIREGDDLYIYADNDSTIIIEDQFLNSTLAYETLTFDDQAIDLASSNLQVMVRTYNPNGIISGSHYFYNYPNGTVSDDIILAGDRDREYYDINLSAGDGNDTIYANYIARLFAGAGNDLIYGRAGTLYAGAGDDTIYLSAEISNSVDNDGSHGEAGDDIFYGSEIRDRVWGDQDDDTLYGYEGDDDLFGGSGNDTIYGGDGDDTISADNSDYGDSNSWITNTGDDEIHGGAGNDYIVVGNGLDIAYGDDGDDHLRVLVGHTNNTDYGWGDKIFYGGAGNDNLSDGRDDDYLDGGSGDDTISASHGGNNTLVGGSGDDFLHAAAGINETSTLNGGFGDDTLTFGGRNNHPKNRSYNGDHNLYGGSGDDTYRTADPGSNMAHQHLGVKTIYDEHGYDDALEIVEYGWAYPNNSVAWTIAKSGDDVVLNYFNSNNQQFTGQITIEDHFMAWHHIESIVFGDTTIELVERLTEFDDTYTASAATSYFGIDDNIVDALDGDDTVYAGIGGDIVYGRGGDDTLYGEDGDDYLFGEDGNDVLYGGDGNDTLDGGEGIDVFKGGAGDDTFIGGDGIDTADYDNLGNAVSVNLMIGTVTGEGTDTLSEVERVVGTDYDDAFIDVAGVSNILVGGAGYDTLNYNGWAQGISVNLSNQSADDGVGGIDTIKQFEHIIGTNYSDELKGSNDYNIIYGGNGRDIIRGYGSSDDLYGGEGNDGLYGGNGNDELYGEAGNDLLKGADGDDTLEGGAGNDLIEGGDQNDTLRGGDDNDVLYGGIHGDDLYGGAGTDHLHGDAGNDDLWGGAGADTFFLTVADDTFGSQDRVYDFSLVDGDMIDLSDLLSDIGYDPLSDTISDWVSFASNSNDSFVSVDQDGIGATYSAEAVMKLNGFTTSDTLGDLIGNGTIITE